MARFRRHLIDAGLLDEEAADTMDRQSARLVADALDEVLALPEPGPDELLTDVVAGDGGG